MLMCITINIRAFNSLIYLPVSLILVYWLPSTMLRIIYELSEHTKIKGWNLEGTFECWACLHSLLWFWLEAKKTVVTEASHVVTHRNTASARTGLTSPIEREGALLSVWTTVPVQTIYNNIKYNYLPSNFLFFPSLWYVRMYHNYCCPGPGCTDNALEHSRGANHDCHHEFQNHRPFFILFLNVFT